MQEQNQAPMMQELDTVDVGVGAVRESIAQQESGVVVFDEVAAVGLVLEAGVELHQHEDLVRRQQREVVGRVGDDVALGRSVARGRGVAESGGKTPVLGVKDEGQCFALFSWWWLTFFTTYNVRREERI